MKKTTKNISRESKKKKIKRKGAKKMADYIEFYYKPVAGQKSWCYCKLKPHFFEYNTKKDIITVLKVVKVAQDPAKTYQNIKEMLKNYLNSDENLNAGREMIVNYLDDCFLHPEAANEKKKKRKEKELKKIERLIKKMEDIINLCDTSLKSL